MITLSALLLLALPSPAPARLAPAGLAPSVTQDDEKPDKREEVKELIDVLKGHFKTHYTGSIPVDA